MTTFSTQTRIDLTSKGWLYQAERSLTLARRCSDATKAKSLRTRAMEAFNRAIQVGEEHELNASESPDV